MKQIAVILVAVIAAAVVSYATVKVTAPQNAVMPAKDKETAFERVTRTGKIRCGYVQYPPVVMKDPNTGAFSGIAVDMMEEIGRLLDLEIVWAEETGFGTMVTGLRAGRYDVMCIGFWRNALEARHVFYTKPYFYTQGAAYVRADDTRFDKSVEAINDPDVTISAVDGELAVAIAGRQFPQAQLMTHPNMTDPVLTLEDVASGKADVTLRDTYMGYAYMQNNPGKLKRLQPGTPLRVYQNTLAIPQGDMKLKSMLDTAIIELTENGVVDEILARYDPTGDIFLRVDDNYAARN